MKNYIINKQVLLFVGRRGFSHTLLCNVCGWTSKCKKCDVHMTFHEYENKLLELREASKRVQEKTDHQINLFK